MGRCGHAVPWLDAVPVKVIGSYTESETAWWRYCCCFFMRPTTPAALTTENTNLWDTLSLFVLFIDSRHLSVALHLPFKSQRVWRVFYTNRYVNDMFSSPPGMLISRSHTTIFAAYCTGSFVWTLNLVSQKTIPIVMRQHLKKAGESTHICSKHLTMQFFMHYQSSCD